MPLFDQSFTQIISGVAPINPGVGGWDVLLSQFMDDRRGRHGFGLLGRTLNLAPGEGNGNRVNLLSVPPGWSCLPLLVGLRLVGAGTAAGDYVYQCTGITGTAETWRAAQSGAITLDDQRMTLQFPTGIFAAFSNDVPWCDGDEQVSSQPSRNVFTVHRNNTSGNGVAVDWFVYGFAWQNND